METTTEKRVLKIKTTLTERTEHQIEKEVELPYYAKGKEGDLYMIADEKTLITVRMSKYLTRIGYDLFENFSEPMGATPCTQQEFEHAFQMAELALKSKIRN